MDADAAQKSMNLNTVALCFQAFTINDFNMLEPITQPVYSTAINNLSRFILQYFINWQIIIYIFKTLFKIFCLFFVFRERFNWRVENLQDRPRFWHLRWQRGDFHVCRESWKK